MALTAVLEAPADRVACAVRAAWVEVLGARAADPDRSILDMRVGAGRVARLMATIEAATGVALPMTTVLQAPTCAALTDIVRSGRTPVPNALHLVKPGDDSPPLFMVPGVGATVFELFDVARRIDCPGAVYACQPHGPDGVAPDVTVEAQAAYLARAIAAGCPGGPYRLTGYSYGGVVAMETARMLQAGGGEIGFVGLLDAPLHEAYWPRSERAAFLMKRLRRHWRDSRGKSLAGQLMHAAGHARTLFSRLRRMAAGGGGASAAASPFHIDGLPPALALVRDTNIEAFNAIKLLPYDFGITLFRSAEGDPLSCDPAAVWPRWVRQMEVRHVPGAHENMLRGRHGIALAASISEALRGTGAETAQS